MNAAQVNAPAMLVSFGLSALLVTVVGRPMPQGALERPREVSSEGSLEDARGRSVPAGAYRRIVSLHAVADAVLLELVEPERLVGVSAHTLDKNPIGYRFGTARGIPRSKDVEAILSLRPDLVVVSKFAGEAYLARLRELGVQVFDLGEMRGVQDTVAHIQTLGALLRQPDRATRIEDDFLRNLAALRAEVGSRDQPWGIYLSVLGDSLFGGTQGTSYADLLHFGGIRDLAAERGFTGWPRYSPEQLIDLNPPVIVTSKGRTTLICGHALLGRLSACGEGGRVVEMPESNHSDPGLGLVDAAQDLQTLLYDVEPGGTSSALGRKRTIAPRTAK